MTLTRAAAPAVAVAVVGAVAGCGGPMQPDELARSVQTIASVAAEGQLMAQDVARDRTRSTFVRAHARELGEDADRQAEKLADAQPGSGLARPKEAAVTLAQRVSDALGQLQVTPGDERTGRRIAAELDRHARQARELQAGL